MLSYQIPDKQTSFKFNGAPHLRIGVWQIKSEDKLRPMTILSNSKKISFCATQMMLVVYCSSEAITAAYLNLTFSTFAQLVDLRSRVLQFQLGLIQIPVPVYCMLYAGQVDIVWGTKAKGNWSTSAQNLPSFLRHSRKFTLVENFRMTPE